MSIEKVRAFFAARGRGGDVLEFPVSSATVELAAQAVGVIPGAHRQDPLLQEPGGVRPDRHGGRRAHRQPQV